jgi:hypothetical protein
MAKHSFSIFVNMFIFKMSLEGLYTFWHIYFCLCWGVMRLYTYHQAFIVYMPSGVYCEADYYTHIIIYSEPSLWGSCCSSRQITCFRVLIPCCAVRNNFGIKMMFGSSLAQLVFFRRGGWFMFYICYLYIFTYTGVQHDFNIIWCSRRLAGKRRVPLVDQ